LNFAMSGGKTEHGDVDGPGAGSHLGELELAVGISEGGENAVPLGRPHGGARQGLARGFDRASLRKGQRECHRQKKKRSDSLHVH
jgi:hypothetical protein